MTEMRLEILKTRLLLQTNEPALLPTIPPPLEVPSLLTAFHKIILLHSAPAQLPVEGTIEISENPSLSHLEFQRRNDNLFLQGPFLHLGQKCTDRRYTLWGNLGLLYRFTLYLLEKKHQIYSLHACSLYDKEKNQLLIVAGGAGSGKTVFLLSGLAQGLQLFSTETTHYQLQENKVVWFKGSLIDNVRLTTLEKYFPFFLPSPSGLPASSAYKSKVALDLSSFQTPFDEVVDLNRVIFIFPHVEEGWPQRKEAPLTNSLEVARRLYANISSKLAESIILYDSLPVVGWEESDLARQRWASLKSLLTTSLAITSLNILSSPADCWGNLLNHLNNSKKVKEN